LGKQQNHAIFPIILVAVGVLFLVGAAASVLLLNTPGDQLPADIPQVEESYPQVSRVDLTQAKSAYDSGTAVFVDVRDQVYFNSGHIQGAVSIPLSEIEDRLDELDPNDWIILYCT
jgi:3-mercaptopyruvate sulfurtransferase SseA